MHQIDLMNERFVRFFDCLHAWIFFVLAAAAYVCVCFQFEIGFD